MSCLAVLAICAGVAAADFQDALALFRAAKYAEAKAAFVQVAEGAAEAERKGEALDMAVRCAVQLREYGEATALAKLIPSEPLSKTSQMDVLVRQRKWRELVDAFAGEELDEWPGDLAARARFLRGQAHIGLRNASQAVEDLGRAVELAPGNPHYWYTLAGARRDLERDPEKAAAAFRKAYEGAGHSGNWLSVSATLDEASIRLHQARPGDALRILERYSDEEVRALSVYWRCRMLRGRAAVHAALGRDRDALDLFAEANRLEAEGG